MMFGLGLGEILLILLIVFLISPKDLPKVMRKIGEFFGAVEKLKKEVFDIKKDVEEMVSDAKIDDDVIYDPDYHVKNSYDRKNIDETEENIEKK